MREKYSVKTKALLFDKLLFHPGEERKTPSIKAKKALYEELPLVFSTVSGWCSAELKEMRLCFDVFIMNEAANTLESHLLWAPVNAVAWSGTADDPFRMVLVGDDDPLPPVSDFQSLAQDLERSVRYYVPLSIKSLCKSLFERLYENRSCPVTVLDTQYRMHPDIASLHVHCFYPGTTINNGKCVSDFAAGYNFPCAGQFFRPITWIDAAGCFKCAESKDGTMTYNVGESLLVEEVLSELFGSHHWDHFSGNITVITPYNRQKRQIIDIWRF